jgi:hypothetical protein
VIRCRCGRWTNFGLTCSRCRTHTLNYGDEDPIEEAPDEEEPEEETIEIDSLLDDPED